GRRRGAAGGGGSTGARRQPLRASATHGSWHFDRAAAMSARQSMIELRDILKTYHLGEIDMPVLKGVSLTIARGEMVALMGASGSGKTTLLNILGCLDRPTSGKYVLDGKEVSNLSKDERAIIRNTKIGFVFQNFNLLPRTSALEQVVMPLTYAHGRVSASEGYRRA